MIRAVEQSTYQLSPLSNHTACGMIDANAQVVRHARDYEASIPVKWSDNITKDTSNLLQGIGCDDTGSQLRTITWCFILYKALLLIIALLTPGVGYDTSTSLLATDGGFSPSTQAILSRKATTWSDWLGLSPLKLARWDGIYFLEAAKRGYVYEQEWAFSWTYSSAVGWIARLIAGDKWLAFDPSAQFRLLTITAVTISHCAHYASAIMLYFLTRTVFDASHPHSPSLPQPLLSTLLHVISPAGAFLSAPTSEAAFSLLNFAGFYEYIMALHCESEMVAGDLLRDIRLLLAGALFALATLVRSNGLLSGCLFAYDFAAETWALLTACQQGRCGEIGSRLRRMFVLVLGGGMIFCGFAVPQFIAYQQYCNGVEGTTRPWCQHVVPAIYGFVQEHYWNVGFLRYWTISNLPLFLLATPMLALLLLSSLTHIGLHLSAPSLPVSGPARALPYLFRIALPQLLLAAAAITNYHVQIINRISSGYPTWYWFIASAMVSTRSAQAGEASEGLSRSHLPCFGTIKHLQGRKGAKIVVRLMVMYGLVQGVLYASFLPPA